MYFCRATQSGDNPDTFRRPRYSFCSLRHPLNKDLYGSQICIPNLLRLKKVCTLRGASIYDVPAEREVKNARFVLAISPHVYVSAFVIIPYPYFLRHFQPP